MKIRQTHKIRWAVLKKLHSLRVDTLTGNWVTFYFSEDKKEAENERRTLLDLHSIGILRIFDYSPSLLERFLKGEKTITTFSAPELTRIRIIDHRFYKLYNDYKAAFEANDLTSLNKYLASLSQTIYISNEEGIYRFYDDFSKSKVYGIRGSRRKLVYALKDNVLSAKQLIGVTGFKDKYAINKAVAKINQECRLKLGLVNDLIVNDPDGYVLQRSAYKIAFVE